MIQYRSFLNTDTPLIVEIWRRQRPMRAAVDSFNRAIFESVVLAKPYFDRHGLIMAVKGGEPLGFVHAGFAPNEKLSDLDFSAGIISQLKVVEGDRQSDVATELLSRACQYLRGKGAKQVNYGSKYPHSPFYLGLYGGSQIGGVLRDDQTVKDLLLEYGFTAQDEILSFSRTLAGFRVAVDRQQMSIRRQFNSVAVADPIENSWWESCVYGLAERDCFHAIYRSSNAVAASVHFWDMQPLAKKWGVSARGMQDLEVEPSQIGTGLDLFLLGESLRHLMQQGIGLVEIQAKSSDQSFVELVKKLGFEATGGSIGMLLNLDS